MVGSPLPSIRGLRVGFIALGSWLVVGSNPGFAQDRLTDFVEKPILVLNSGAHSAPVRRLIFDKESLKLLSGGDDKVARVWDFKGDPTELVATIRPPIWRGPAGTIKAMALSHVDGKRPRTLAVAGIGVQSKRGEILLFRYPGAADRPTGDIEGVIDGEKEKEGVPGHSNPVTCLAFHPSNGRILASGSNDTTVRLWDLETRKQLALLSEPGQTEVNAIAFTPDGKRLVVGGRDGTIRVWDVEGLKPEVVARSIPRARPGQEADRAGLRINALDVSPDGLWVVVGREDGSLIRFDLKTEQLAWFPTGKQQGPVEALAFGPDGRLATSIVHRRLERRGDLPSVECDIETWRVGELARGEHLDQSTNLVYALAFLSTPKRTVLAFAGGDRQEIRRVDLDVPIPDPLQARPVLDLNDPKAGGSSVWDVGFFGDMKGDAKDEVKIAYSRDHPDRPRPADYPGFDLRDRSRATFAAAGVRRAITAWEGWTVNPTNWNVLEVKRAGVNSFRVELTDVDGRWYAYSFLPPGPKHDRPALAVACVAGVVIYRLEDRPRGGEGVRTRFLDGHSAAVYALAPSPDGRWLATGSADQTVRLWSLAGCDTLAPLGADFQARADGLLVVKSVEPWGFADVGGLKVGDVVRLAALGREPLSGKDFLDRYPSSPPNFQIGLEVLRAGVPELLIGTTKRDRPVLSLFVALDREWVLWMPRGYYDSSVVGDSTFLGWHLNRSMVFANPPMPTDFLPIRTYEQTLRQPKSNADNALDRLSDNIIDRLLTSADESVAMEGRPPVDVPAVVQVDQPPRVNPVAGPADGAIRGGDGAPIAPGLSMPNQVRVGPGPFEVSWQVEPKAGEQPGLVELRVDGRRVRDAAPPPLGMATLSQRYDLAPGTYTLTAIADNGPPREQHQVVTRERHLVVTVEGPAKPAQARLKVLAVAPTFTDPKFPRIALIHQDAKDLATFFSQHAVTATGKGFPKDDPLSKLLLNDGAKVKDVFKELAALQAGPIETGDLVVVLIESHVLNLGKLTRVIVSDSEASPLINVVPADTISTALESLVRQGCRVLVILDGVHPTGTRIQGGQPDLVEWVRRLRNNHGVITAVASTRGPVEAPAAGHRALAQAILNATRNAPRRPTDDSVISLADLRQAIIEEVQRLSNARGEPQLYIPEGIQAGQPILSRKPQ